MTDKTVEQEHEVSQGCGPGHSGSRDGQSAPATAALAGVFPDVLDGHWTTADGREMAERYANQPRSTIGFADHTDFALANAVYMADRNSLDLIVLQTAAKDRIRWLSANLAASRTYVEIANRDLGKVYDENQALLARAIAAEEALKEAADALAIEARANEMSANIMRDRRRTGGWEGAERTAAAFDRNGLKVAGIRAKLLSALTHSSPQED